MLDIAALDASLKIKAIGRLGSSRHPFFMLFKEKCNLTDFFEPSCPPGIETVISKGLSLLKLDRDSLWGNEGLRSNSQLIETIQNINIAKIINGQGKLSIPYFMARRRGLNKVKDLNMRDLRELERYIEVRKRPLISIAVALPNLSINVSIETSVHSNGKFKDIMKCSSKEIRTSRAPLEPIREFKIGINLTRAEATNWGFKLTKLTSIKHRNILLKVAHGEVYTKEKLHRYNLIDSDSCPRCGETETLKHKFIECDYVKRIWQHAATLTSNLMTTNQVLIESCMLALGSYIESTPTILTLHAELLLRILYLKDDQNYLVHPKNLVKHCLKYIARCEKKPEIKDEIKSLLEL